MKVFQTLTRNQIRLLLYAADYPVIWSKRDRKRRIVVPNWVQTQRALERRGLLEGNRLSSRGQVWIDWNRDQWSRYTK